MRIVLLQDVKNVGKKWDVKDVHDGYARNFLIARKLAKIATREIIQTVVAKKDHEQKEHVEMEKRTREIVTTLKDRTIEFSVKTDDAGTIFGSITKEAILKALREQHVVTKERIEIHLEHPIKKCGEYRIPVTFGPNIKGELRVLITRLQL